MIYLIAAIACFLVGTQAKIDWDSLPIVTHDGVQGVWEEWVTSVGELPKRRFISLEELKERDVHPPQPKDGNRRRLANNDQLSNSDKAQLTTAHNEYRSQVAVGQLGSQPAATDMTEADWNEDCADWGANWLSQCNWGHSSGSGYGENIYISAGYGDLDDINEIVKAVDSWAGEYTDYSYSQNSGNGAVVGHYTQVVWADSTTVGCAYTTSCSCSELISGWNYPTCLYVICNYSPAGNYNGQRPYTQASTCNQVATECPNGWASNQGCGMCYDDGNGADGCYSTDCYGNVNGDGTPSPTRRPTTATPTPAPTASQSGDDDGNADDNGDDGNGDDDGDINIDEDCNECTVAVSMTVSISPYNDYADAYYASRDAASAKANEILGGNIGYSTGTSYSYQWLNNYGTIVWTTTYTVECGSEMDYRDSLATAYEDDSYASALESDLRADVDGYHTNSLVILVEKSSESGNQAYNADGEEDDGSSSSNKDSNDGKWWIWFVVILCAIIVGSVCGFSFAMWRSKQDAKQMKQYQQMVDIQY